MKYAIIGYVDSMERPNIEIIFYTNDKKEAEVVFSMLKDIDKHHSELTDIGVNLDFYDEWELPYEGLKIIEFKEVD